MSSRIFLFLADLSLIYVVQWVNRQLLPFTALVNSRRSFLGHLVRNFFILTQFISIYYFNRSKLFEVYLLFYFCCIIIPNAYKVLTTKRMIAELLLISSPSTAGIRFGKITSSIKTSDIQTLTKQIHIRQPDGLVVNTSDKSILRYTLLHSHGKPVIKLIPTPSLLKISDLFEVYHLVPNSKAYLCADYAFHQLILKKLPVKSFTPITKADYVLDLTCMNTKISKLFDRPQSIKLANKNNLPLFVLTPIQSLSTMDAIIYRAYEATMMEYSRVIIARIPSLVEVGIEFPKIKKELLCVHLSKLFFYTNSLWEKYKRNTGNERIVEFLEGDPLFSEDLELLLERIKNS